MAKHGPIPKKLDIERVESVSAMGGTNEQIAAALGVSPTTLKNIRKRDKAVDEAVARGKDKADLQVVASLYKKAIGYDTVDRQNNKVWMAGDTTAMIFWLKNRRPAEWKDRKDWGISNAPDADGKDREFIIKVIHTRDGDGGNGNGDGVVTTAENETHLRRRL